MQSNRARLRLWLMIADRLRDVDIVGKLLLDFTVMRLTWLYVIGLTNAFRHWNSTLFTVNTYTSLVLRRRCRSVQRNASFSVNGFVLRDSLPVSHSYLM